MLDALEPCKCAVFRAARSSGEIPWRPRFDHGFLSCFRCARVFLGDDSAASNAVVTHSNLRVVANNRASGAWRSVGLHQLTVNREFSLVRTASQRQLLLPFQSSIDQHNPLPMLARLLLAISAVITSSSAIASAQAADAPHWADARTIQGLVSAGYMRFGKSKGLAVYAARTGREVDDEMFAQSDDIDEINPDPVVQQAINAARGVDQFARRDAMQDLSPLFASYRQEALDARGLLIRLPSARGDYDFNRGSFTMAGKLPDEPQKFYPSGLSCSSRVDDLAKTGRGFCIYLSNFNKNGRYELPLDDRLARRFASKTGANATRVFVLAEFDGPPQVPQPRNAAAATQAMRVVAIALVEPDGSLMSIVPFDGQRMAGLSKAPALNAAGSRPGAAAIEQRSESPPASPLRTVPMKTIKRSGEGVSATSGATKKPIVVDIKN